MVNMIIDHPSGKSNEEKLAEITCEEKLFSNRVRDIWNHLPTEVKNANTVNQLKKKTRQAFEGNAAIILIATSQESK